MTTKLSYTADEAIGIKINELMFRNRVSRKALGEALGLSGQAVSKKVLGKAAWSMEELFAVAMFFNVEVADLLPRLAGKPENEETPSTAVEGVPLKKLVAGAGFEPTTSGL